MSNFIDQIKIINLLGGKLAMSPMIPIGLMIIICIGILCFKRRGLWPFIRQIVIVLLLFVINLRIMIPDNNAVVKQEVLGAKVLFVIDGTISMVAEDYNGNGRRLDAVKSDCEYIIDSLPGAEFAVISFNNVSQVMTTYNADASFTKNAIDSINPLMELYARGTTLNICQVDMLDLLKSASADGSDSVILFFISDGENTLELPLSSFAEAKDYVDGGAVLGYGTEEGGTMRVLDYNDEWETVMDTRDWSNYKEAVSCIDEQSLRAIAKDIDIEYVHMTEQKNIDAVLREVSKETTRKTVDKRQVCYHETYYWFAIPLSLMLVLEFILLKRKS